MKIHMVKKGDTLYSLSKKYGVSLDQLIAMNPQLVDPNQLTVGMKVKVPSANYPAGDYEIIHKHVVKEGDTLWKLSKAWGVPLNVMIAANPQLKNPNILLIGQVINIAKLGSEKMEEDAVSNNKHDNMMPKSKAEKLQPKEEMLQATDEMVQSKEAENQQELLQEQVEKQEEKVEQKQEQENVIMPLEANEKENMKVFPSTKEEAVPIPLSQQHHMEEPIAPYAVYHAKEQTATYSAPLLKPYTASMPAIPVLPDVVANTEKSAPAAIPSPYSMNNLVPCNPPPWSSGCDMSSYSGSVWGNPLGSGCVQGVYLGNCPPGTIPLSHWDGIATQAYTMYSQYDVNQSPLTPSSNYSGMSIQQAYGMPVQNPSFTGYSHMPETNANVMYGQYSQPLATDYSNMTHSHAINNLNVDHQQASKSRIDSMESVENPIAGEQETKLLNEAIQVGDKSAPVKKSNTKAKKKTKASSATKIRQKRGSMPWINA